VERLAFAVAVSITCWSSLTRANDSTAVLGAGGLVLTKSQDISMESEELEVGDSLIRVRYVFKNEGAADVKDFTPTEDLKLVSFGKTPPRP
jgi:hypothetical protein